MIVLNKTSWQLSTKARRRLAIAGICTWSIIIGSGMCLLSSYTNQPGLNASPPKIVPQFAMVQSTKFRLLMFAHPHCPCTAASISELARLLCCCGKDVQTTVYFYRPRKEDDSWASGRLWEAAAAIPGVQVEVDPQGEMAARFDSTTSGTLMLFDSSGQLRFHGGITPARGHEGDCLGKSAIVTIVTGNSLNVDHTPVFGCALSSATE